MNNQNHRDATRGTLGADTARVGRRPARRRQPFRPSRQATAWLWLVVLIVAVAANGCGGGGGDKAQPAEGSTPTDMAGGMGPQPATAPAQPKQQPKQEAAEPKKPLPENVSDWVTDDYYRARREGNAKLRDAVAYLGEHFAGTEQADKAAQLLTNLLKKTEEPAAKPGARQQPGMPPGGYPGAMPGGYPSPSPEGYPGAMPGSPPAGMPPGMGADGGYGPGTEGAPEEQYTEGADSAGGAQPYGPGYGMPGAGPGYGRGPTRATGFVTELIEAIVQALGVNASATARKTLTEVVEGTFETDNNRVATLATLETLVAHLCSEYEDVLYRCLTAPEKLRPLGKSGPAAQPGQPPYGGQYGEAYGQGYPSQPGAAGTGPLTAEELQRNAFLVIAPKASEQFRVRLAKHLADPTSPREDYVLFGDFICELHPENVAAQMVLYANAGMDAETKATVEENFIAYSSDALASILGIPEEQRAVDLKRRSSRRQPGRGPGQPGMYPGMPPEGYPGMEEMEGEQPPGMDPRRNYPGAEMPRSPAGAGTAGRPSRYGSQPGGGERGDPSGRPSRYGSGQAGARQPGFGPDEVQKLDPELPYRLARHLWGTEMTGLLEGRLNQIGSLEENGPLVLLASTMPVDSTRLALGQLLQAHWEDGPGSLESAGLLDDVVSDPGFLVLVKMLKRKEPQPETGPIRTRPPRTTSSRTQPGRVQPGRMQPEGMQPGEERFGPSPEMMPGGARAAGAQAEQVPEVAWMLTSEDLVRVLCERFRAAATARARAAGMAGPPSAGEEAGHGLPFKLRTDATVVAEYHLDWPSGEQQRLSGVPLGQLTLHYVRTEQDAAKLVTLESFYKRQLDFPNTQVHPIESGSWMESLEPVPDTDKKRSIDLMFTVTVPVSAELDKKKDLPVTTEILCIDMKDPQATGGGG